MGLHLSVYLGPYVECSYRNERQEIDVVGCTNPKCQEYAKRDRHGSKLGKYCSACASPIGSSKRMDLHRPTPYDVFGGDREELMLLGWDRDDLLRFGSNVRGLRNFHPKGEGRVDLSSINVADEMRWFEDRFAEALGKLRGAYDTVTIKWGLHLYYL